MLCKTCMYFSVLKFTWISWGLYCWKYSQHEGKILLKFLNLEKLLCRIWLNFEWSYAFVWKSANFSLLKIKFCEVQKFSSHVFIFWFSIETSAQLDSLYPQSFPSTPSLASVVSLELCVMLSSRGTQKQLVRTGCICEQVTLSLLTLIVHTPLSGGCRKRIEINLIKCGLGISLVHYTQWPVLATLLRSNTDVAQLFSALWRC